MNSTPIYQKKAAKRYYEKNAEQIKEKQRNYYLENKDKIKERCKNYYQTKKKNNETIELPEPNNV
jgi:hypothetical protein